MGTWDVGPFDNDTAADWCGDLHDAAPAQRTSVVRSALTTVLDNGDDYLDSNLADEAIAAAAIVASQLPGGARITSPYAPDFCWKAASSKYPMTSRRWRCRRWIGSSATTPNGASSGRSPTGTPQPSPSFSRSRPLSKPPRTTGNTGSGALPASSRPSVGTNRTAWGPSAITLREARSAADADASVFFRAYSISCSVKAGFGGQATVVPVGTKPTRR